MSADATTLAAASFAPGQAAQQVARAVRARRVAPDFVLPPWLCGALLDTLQDRYSTRLPAAGEFGFTIGGEDDPYLRRWFVLPRGDAHSVYLHQFVRDDDDRALHDHPWDSLCVVLRGGYVEHLPDGPVIRQVGDVVLRQAEHRHRVQLMRDAAGRPVPAWTLFLVGPRVRDWGFWCPGAADGATGAEERFVPWRDFTAGEHGEVVGKGCGA